MDAWLRWRTWARVVYSADTARTYSNAVFGFIADTGARGIAEYDEDAVAEWFDDRGFRGRTKWDKLKALQSFFGWCVRRQRTTENPVEFIPAKRPRRVKAVTLSQDELVRALVAAAYRWNERVAWALLLIYLLGVRRGEAAGMKWDDIREGSTGLVIEINVTKGADRREALPLSPLASECLRMLKELPSPGNAGHRRLGPEFIFGVRRQTITRWMHDAGSAAGLHPKKLGPHRLRATLATNLLKDGVDIRAVQKVLGHRDLESTAFYLEDADEGEVRHALSRARVAV